MVQEAASLAPLLSLSFLSQPAISTFQTPYTLKSHRYLLIMLAQIAVALSGAAAVSASATLLPRQGSGATISSPGAIGFEYPAIRGWARESATVQPCGGFALGGRSDFPVTGGQVGLIQSRDGNDIQLSYSTNADPQSLADFQPLLPNITHLFGGTACLQTPDFTSLGLAAGQVVTLQLQYNAGPQRNNFHQCADITLVPQADYTPASNFTCTNYTRSTQTRSGANTALVSSDAAASTESAAPAASTAPTSGASNLHIAAGSVVGAAVLAAASAFVF